MSDPATDEGLARAVLQMVEESGNAGVTRPRLASRAGAHAQRIADSVDRAVREGRLVIVDETVLSAQAVRVLERQLTDILGAYHRREPFSEGMAREEARARVSGRVPPAVFDWMIGRLGRSGVVRAGERLALESHRAVSTAEDRSATRKIESICRDAGFTPPDLSGVVRAAGLATAVTDRLVTRLIREKTLVRISGLLFHEETLSRLRDEVKRLKEEGKSGLDVRDVKQRFGLTRKHAIPLLEYLDRERITRRQGDSRVIL
jgi:selenocysteine-specific elongation factor